MIDFFYARKTKVLIIIWYSNLFDWDYVRGGHKLSWMLCLNFCNHTHKKRRILAYFDTPFFEWECLRNWQTSKDMILFYACMKNEDFNQNLILKPFGLRLCQRSSQIKSSFMIEYCARMKNKGFVLTKILTKVT